MRKLLLGLVAAALAVAGVAYGQGSGQSVLTTLLSTYYVPIQTTGPLNTIATLATLQSYLASNGQGIATGTAPTVFHSGGVHPNAVADGTDATAVNTQTVICEMFVPVNTTLTGIKWLGNASSTGNVQFSLATSAGVPIAAAKTASTATSATANYQTAAFATPYVAIGPQKFFVLMQNSGANHFQAVILGNYGAAVKTGETFGTFTTVTPPTTFTTIVCPYLDTY
jgi:hypothetical protein